MLVSVKLEPLQMVQGEVRVVPEEFATEITADGLGFTIKLKLFAGLVQLALLTVNVPEQVPGCVLAGTLISIGLEDNTAFEIGLKEFDGDALQVILQDEGALVVLVQDRATD